MLFYRCSSLRVGAFRGYRFMALRWHSVAVNAANAVRCWFAPRACLYAATPQQHAIGTRACFFAGYACSAGCQPVLYASAPYRHGGCAAG